MRNRVFDGGFNLCRNIMYKIQEKDPKLIPANQNVTIHPKYIRHVMFDDGFMYYPNQLLFTVNQVRDDYYYQDISKEDRILDIGACVGGFTVPASRKGRSVYAVEPITPDRLSENIRLNGINNVTVENGALGNGEEVIIEWNGEVRRTKTRTLSQLIKMADGCDFLKCDCEGGEWSIMGKELREIRRIEMEVHQMNDATKINKMIERVTDAGFFVITDDIVDTNRMKVTTLHAINMNIVSDCSDFFSAVSFR